MVCILDILLMHVLHMMDSLSFTYSKNCKAYGNNQSSDIFSTNLTAQTNFGQTGGRMQ